MLGGTVHVQMVDLIDVGPLTVEVSDLYIAHIRSLQLYNNHHFHGVNLP